MKKTIIASIVGGILLFAWQFLSWPILNLHKAANRYTPNQDAILAALNANLPEEGGYMLPGLPENATSAEHEKLMEETNGKPQANIQYHKSTEASAGAMIKNMVRGLLIDIITVWLFCWILARINAANFRIIFIASLLTGFIVFFNSAYSVSIWYKWFDIMAYFTDAIVSWGVCGLWLGWWLPRK
ncbi:MAG: hypothetical protein ABI760_03175 [Ferruginibacter sp.]